MLVLRMKKEKHKKQEQKTPKKVRVVYPKLSPIQGFFNQNSDEDSFQKLLDSVFGRRKRD